MRELLAELTRALCDVRSPVGEEAALAEQLAYRPGAERIGNSVVLGRATGAKRKFRFSSQRAGTTLRPVNPSMRVTDITSE